MTSLKRTSQDASGATNLSSKVYVRTTRSGKVQKIVREVYLRQDIPCSSKLCSVCQKNAPTTARHKALPPVLSENPASSKLVKTGHYLIPDTNAFLNGMDLFEVEDDFKDVIVLQTVLEEVKNRSLPLYHRLVNLTKNDDKRFYTFFNDFRAETFIHRDQGESINDRNDRAIRRAATWYQEHLKSTVSKKATLPSIVLITDDRANMTKAKSDEILVYSLTDYVSGLENADRLLDMANDLSQKQEIRRSDQKDIYPDYYSMSKMLTGIKSGNFHQASFSVSPFNYLEGSVKATAFDKPLLILGRANSNRAVAGDIVCVEILSKDQWKAPSTKIVEEENINQNDNADVEDGENVISERERRTLQEHVKAAHGNTSESQPQPTARVVGVIKRNWRQYVGHIDPASVRTSNKQSRTLQSVFLLPMDKKIPKIRLRTRQAGELVGKRVLVTIDSWDRDSRYPSGHFVRSLGDLESKGAETEALLLEYDVQYRPFPKTVLDCLPTEGHEWKVPVAKDDPLWTNRRDLRDLLVCSIDPIGCVDIDDALHAYKLPNGNYAVGVHIADVSHFVKPDTAMDKEASMRGTTVYLVDKRIDMLPTLLGTDLCSLKPYVERFAFSVLWELSPDADIISAEFTKSVIRSREAFSYEAAQVRIDDDSKTDDLTTGMRILLALSRKLKGKRMAAGALSLSSPEIKVQVESETSDPIDVKAKQLLATNSLVEEFMLLANCSVAAHVRTAFPQTALLRRHAPPPASNFEELANQLRVKRNMTLHTESSKALAESLDTCVDAAHPFFNTLVRILVTRCMTAASYFPAGLHSETEFLHYGLAAPIYTHFTSPIRRYADLEVHRQLAAAISYENLHPSLLSKARLEGVTDNLNVRHRNAQNAGRASVAWYVGQALKGRVVVEEAWITRVFENGVGVFVPRYGLEGLVRLRDMGCEGRGVFDGVDYTLTVSGDEETESKGWKVELFGRVKVKIMDVVDGRTGVRGVRMEIVV
jgi:exosome complex exonuclease DIS3/RRP44